MKIETATFGAGCFWGVEESFRNLDGVQKTRVGYAGGKKENPTYEDVCNHKTGHAEVVEVTYDSDIISYKKLLEKFFEIHDPTQLNRQGPDIGDQYRSVIFTHSDEQEKEARDTLETLNQSGKYSDPIATQIKAVPTFYEAEEYHQKYVLKKGDGTCHI